LAKDLPIVPDAVAVGVKAGQDGVATGTAKREGAIRPIESHRDAGQGVQVGSRCAGVAVASDLIVEIVGHDPKDIPAWLLGASFHHGLQGQKRGDSDPEEGSSLVHRRCFS
jgi:hypothetical protein